MILLLIFMIIIIIIILIIVILIITSSALPPLLPIFAHQCLYQFVQTACEFMWLCCPCAYFSGYCGSQPSFDWWFVTRTWSQHPHSFDCFIVRTYVSQSFIWCLVRAEEALSNQRINDGYSGIIHTYIYIYGQRITVGLTYQQRSALILEVCPFQSKLLTPSTNKWRKCCVFHPGVGGFKDGLFLLMLNKEKGCLEFSTGWKSSLQQVFSVIATQLVHYVYSTCFIFAGGISHI